jgi:predicted transcriptional regulator
MQKPVKVDGLSNLKKWIEDEMTIDIESELLKHKEKVKNLVQLTKTGDVILKQTDLTAKQKILVYLIGKTYSKVADYTQNETATNKEIIETLGLPEGTVKNVLFDLRNEGIVNSLESGVHRIRVANIGLALGKYFEGESKS